MDNKIGNKNNTNKYIFTDFMFEEDFVISAECEDCGYYTEDENDFEDDCPECGGYLINETSHEDCKCSICNLRINIWDNAYRHKKKHDILICTDCYESLRANNILETVKSTPIKDNDCHMCKHYWGNAGCGVNPDDICYGKGDCRSCKVSADYAWKFEHK